MTRLTANELLMLRAAGPLAPQLMAFYGQPSAARREEIYVTDSRPGPLGRLARRVAKGFTQARSRRRVIDQLARMDDRMLRDIGLDRSTLTEAVDAALEKREPTWALENALDSLAGLGKAVVNPIVRWHRKAVTLGELEQLDDRLLNDIGLTRGDLRYTPSLVLDRIEAANDDVANPDKGDSPRHAA